MLEVVIALAVPFDLKRLEVTGPTDYGPSENVSTDSNHGLADFAVSRDGSLLYAPGGAKNTSQTMGLGRSSRAEPACRRDPPALRGVRLSPRWSTHCPGSHGATSEIWLQTWRGPPRPGWYTGGTMVPRFGHPTARVTFGSNRATLGGDNLFWQTADGTGMAERLTRTL